MKAKTSWMLGTLTMAAAMCGVGSVIGAPPGVADALNESLEIQAQIDGRDQLILKGNTAQWHHFDFAAVGRERGSDAPTLIGGIKSSTDTSILWLPVWPSPPPDEIRSEALSSVLQGLRPSIPSNGAPWQVERIFGRGAVTIVEQPTPANAFTLIVEFDDYKFGGSSFYGVILSQAPVKVQIDVKPYLTGGGINLGSGEYVRVAIIGGGEFDALQVNPASARLGPGGARPTRYEIVDYNRDGFTDRGLVFRISYVGLACGDQQVTLTADTYDGTMLVGTDFVHAYNCHK